jgi:hypothetical protein
MKEGTWTVERPRGGAPSSWVKGTAGGGGGVKGPHSDSSTPSLEGQQPKKKPGTPKCGQRHIWKLTQFHLSLLGVSRVTRTRRRTGGKSWNV